MLEEAIKLSGRKGEPAPLDWEPGDARSSEVDPVDPVVPERVEARVAVPELSHPGESQSNGSSERGVQMVEDMVRTLKAAVEDRIGKPVPSTSPLMRWLFHHASFLLTKYHVGPDGFTGYMRLHGKGTHLDRICEFGEKIRWFVPKKRRTKLEPKWRNGLCLGAHGARIRTTSGLPTEQ